MVNKRFLQTAERWMNKDVFIERAATQPRAQNSIIAHHPVHDKNKMLSAGLEVLLSK